MAKGVLTTKLNPVYDDLPEQRYHFPGTYLGKIEAIVGDLFVYYEPRRIGAGEAVGGRQAYFATARLEGVTKDRSRANHFYAHITDYLEFPEPVPFRSNSEYFESALKRGDSATNKGAFRRAVRTMPEGEFEAILCAGFPARLEPWQEDKQPGFAEPASEFNRPIIEQITNRPYRDKAFKWNVRAAYLERCAVTGLKLINGGGRPEVQAAHIRPVASNGPDSVRNGIALCGTAHWLFDRGIISVADDYSILVSDSSNSDEMLKLINPEHKLLLPENEALRPHPSFLKFHRNEVFKP